MEGGVVPYSSSMAPSGSYILVIVSQPVTSDHKQGILDRLNKALLSWDIDSTGCDLSGLETVCSSITQKNIIDSDVLLQHSTESLGVEILVSPTVSTLKQCVRNLFSTSTGHKHLIHTGYTFAGSGSWIIQNGTFSYDDFLEIFQQADVQSQKRCTINIHCAEVGPWNKENFAKDIFTKVADVSLNAESKVDKVPGSENLINCLDRVLSSQDLEEIMASSSVVGNIRFNRPTLYLFPAGQGDCALFGISGFNMLIDGGFNRKPCSWEFIRHLDRLDAVLVTRLCENNVCGMSTLMKRKSINNTYPQIGYVFCNIAESSVSSLKRDNLGEKDDFIVSVVEESHKFTQTLDDLKLKPHQCWRESSVEPFVLYHKVGHGTLEMHVLSPPKDSKEMKQFLTQWNSYKESFSNTNTGSKSKNLEGVIPLAHAISICAVLIWRPADPKDTITRILFPGSAPQNKIFESLEKLKALDILKQPIVTKELLTVTSLTKVISKDKTVNRVSVPNRKNTASPALSVSSATSKNGDIGEIKKEIKKENKEMKVKKEVKKIEPIIKKEIMTKKESVQKDIKKETKEIKKIAKKEVKDVKSSVEKKTEVKSTQKKSDASTMNVSKSNSAVKKTAMAVKKTTTTSTKTDTSKVSVPKSTELKKSSPGKLADTKPSPKNSPAKKASDVKSVPKSKPSGPPKAAPKSKPSPAAETKSSSKMTKAVAASSIVASAVAVTAAAFSLSEKNDKIMDEIKSLNEEGNEQENLGEVKDLAVAEKSEEMRVSPLPPEALSPTPSESISLSPSDTLSSAPLETVSPTPPLAGNEPMSLEEKEVNEIKDIEQDLMPDDMAEVEVAQEPKCDLNKEVEEEIDVEEEIEKHKKHEDVMSMSFMESSQHEKDIEGDMVENFMEKNHSPSTGIDNPEHIESEKNISEVCVIENSSEIDIDDRLAHMSMDGSFVAVPSQEQQNIEYEQVQDDAISDMNWRVSKNENQIFNTEDVLEYSEQKFNNGFEKEKQFLDRTDEKEIHDKKNVLESTELHENEEVNIAYESKEENFRYNNSETEDNYREEELEIQNQQQEVAFDSEKESFQIDNYEKEEQDEEFKEKCGLDTKEQHLTSDNKHEEIEYEEKQSPKNETYENLASGSLEEHTKDAFDKVKSMENEHIESDVQIQQSSFSADNRLQDIEKSFDDNKSDSEEEKDVIEEKYFDRDSSHDAAFLRNEVYNNQSESTFYNHSQDYDVTQNIIQDSEMQESSVDEPEEILKVQSDYYEDNFASNIEVQPNSENYLTSEFESMSEEPHVNNEEEVVVSSTAPLETCNEEHAKTVNPSFNQKVALNPNEKHDFDEKDRDSAEDDMEGEMIRHPTPPDMKYMEEEMRDPIGPHFITTPSLKTQGMEFTEQPLYEEPEDGSSDRSESPVVEQPVFGNVGQADFPELVTVSGGTTPSEPQSPKTFESKKFASEKDVMDALSEHDCSEGSAHSPLLHEGETAFEMPVEEHTVRQEVAVSQEYQTYEFVNNEPTAKLEDKQVIQANLERNEDLQNEGVSDDESHSQIEKSETKSEKSEGPDDEKSDVHRDDKSDNHHDGKSDITDDDHVESRSDIHDDDNISDSHCDDRQDNYYDEQGSSNYGIEDQMHDYESRTSNERNECLLEEFESEIAMNQKTIAEIHTSEVGKQYEDMSFQRTYDYEHAQSEITSKFKNEVINYHDEKSENNNITSGSCDSVLIGFQNENMTSAYPTKTYDEDSTEHYSTDKYESKYCSGEFIKNDKDLTMSEKIGNQSSENMTIGEKTEIKTTAMDLSRDMKPFDIQDDVAPQYSEQFSTYENKILTEMTEAHQRETFSKYEDNSHISNMVYSEDSHVSNKVSEDTEFQSTLDSTDDKNQYYPQEETTYSSISQEKMNENESYDDQIQMEYSTDYQGKHYADSFHTDYKFSSEIQGVEDAKKDYSNPQLIEDDRYSGSISHVAESLEGYQQVEENIKVNQDDFNDNDLYEKSTITSSTDSAESRETWSHTQYTTQECSSKKVYSAITEHESSYIINSRFHSDSPEDNVMRSDSSPDVPPYPINSEGRLSDFGNLNPNESFKPVSPNMNLPSSPNKVRNSNRDDPYEESSDEDDSSSAPIAVSPYAYTNKAYAKEEDIDGNHIYQEDTTNSKTVETGHDDSENLTNPQQPNYSTQAYSETANYDFRLEEWGKPMGLPTPPEGAAKTVTKKVDKSAAIKSQTNGKTSSAAATSKLSSPLKKPKPKASKESSSSPVYVDLAYVPHHGDPQYCDIEFFKKVRARYYVFSGINPSKEVLNALLDAKKSWKEELDVTIIPTYETDTLGYWMAQNQDDLALYSIEVAPSASRCTVNLQDHETSCAAYRLEF